MGNLFYRIASWTGAWKLMSEIRIAEKKRNVGTKRFWLFHMTRYEFWSRCQSYKNLKICKITEKNDFFCNKLDCLVMRKILICDKNALAYQCNVQQKIMLVLYNWVRDFFANQSLMNIWLCCLSCFFLLFSFCNYDFTSYRT